MSMDKLPVFEEFPPGKEQHRLVLWIKTKIFRPISRRINFLLSLLNSGFVEIPADDVDPGTDGNWRWRADGADLVLQRLISGTWTDTALKILSTGITRIGDGGSTNYTELSATGVQTMAGSARVAKIQQIHLSSMKRGVGSPPGEGLKDGFPTLDFDDSADEEVFFSFSTPEDYDVATDMAMHAQFFVDTAPVAAAGVYWAVEWKAIAPGETVDFASGTGTVGDTCAITTGTPANDALLLDCEGLTGGAGTIAAGDLILCRLYRDVSNAGDTFVGDVRLIGAHVHFTANKHGEAL